MTITAQRDLFGKRQRKLPPAPEFKVHCMVADALRVSIQPGWLWFHVPNGEYRSERTGERLKRMGVKPGVSDILLIAPPAGLLHALELKRRGEKPNYLQTAFLEAVVRAGGMAGYADTFDGAMTILMGWGAVRLKL
jgi:hypothetical protein